MAAVALEKGSFPRSCHMPSHAAKSVALSLAPSCCHAADKPLFSLRVAVFPRFTSEYFSRSSCSLDGELNSTAGGVLFRMRWGCRAFFFFYFELGSEGEKKCAG